MRVNDRPQESSIIFVEGYQLLGAFPSSDTFFPIPSEQFLAQHGE